MKWTAIAIIVAFTAAVIGAGKNGDTAFELHCTTVDLIVMPATGPTLDQAKHIADCLGNNANACTIEVIKVRRTK